MVAICGAAPLTAYTVVKKMANITEQDVARTIHSMITAGKKMPQSERLNSSANIQQEAQAILKDTVALWAGIFVPRKIDIERWEKALSKALTLSEVGTINTNLITPALMEAGLRAAEAEHMQNMQMQTSQEKLEEVQGIKTDDYQTRALWRWTIAKLAEGRPIMAYAPIKGAGEEIALEVLILGKKLQMTDEEVKQQNKVLEIYLNDKNYCNASGKRLAYEPYLRNDRKVGFRKVAT